MSSGTSTQTVQVPERAPEQAVEYVPIHPLPQPETKKPKFSITIVSSIPV